MPNGRCRIHGGKNPGAPKGNRNAWKHGAKAASTRETLALIKQLGRTLDEFTEIEGAR